MGPGRFGPQEQGAEAGAVLPRRSEALRRNQDTDPLELLRLAPHLLRILGTAAVLVDDGQRRHRSGGPRADMGAFPCVQKDARRSTQRRLGGGAAQEHVERVIALTVQRIRAGPSRHQDQGAGSMAATGGLVERGLVRHVALLRLSQTRVVVQETGEGVGVAVLGSLHDGLRRRRLPGGPVESACLHPLPLRPTEFRFECVGCSFV